MNFFEKIQVGWWWIGECFDEWCWTMTHDDGEFFNYIQCDYVGYEEMTYFGAKPETTLLPKEDFDALQKRLAEPPDPAIMERFREILNRKAPWNETND